MLHVEFLKICRIQPSRKEIIYHTAIRSATD